MPKDKQKPLQKYLEKDLPPFARGTGDCVAWTIGWINFSLGKKTLKANPMTFGDVVRSLRSESLVDQTDKRISSIGGSRTDSPSEGSVVIYKLEQAFEGLAIGVLSEGKAITRMEADSLHITQDPEIIASWNISSQ